MPWDLFCRVVDNFGDIGVGWRLAADLAARGVAVRLWVDDASALAWMAPGGARGVQVLRFGDAAAAEPGEVVVEMFGAEPPPAFLAAMAARPRGARPAWIDVEYLSAEPYAERSHGLPSPQQAGPGAGLVRWFWFPGFTPRTGGLIREPGFDTWHAGFDRDAWLAARGIGRAAGERVVSLFCYPNPLLAALPALLGDAPTLLVATAGLHARIVPPLPPRVRVAALPFVAQPEYDRLLRAADWNLVRGEDSLVRAIWAGRPFVWQAYPQRDGVHAAKLDALLAALQAPPDLAATMRWWNGLGTPNAAPPPPWPAADAASAAVDRWRASLLAQPDLATQLTAFAASRQTLE